jgi:hypothetical protein
VIAEKICTIKKNPSILYRDNREGALSVSQELTRNHLAQAQGCKGVNSCERHGLRRALQGTLLTGPPRKVFPHVQLFRRLETTETMAGEGKAGY